MKNYGEISYKDDFCPMSGVGQPPSKWGKCFAQCSWYDEAMGYCSVQALWRLRELPGMRSELEGAAVSTA